MPGIAAKFSGLHNVSPRNRTHGDNPVLRDDSVPTHPVLGQFWPRTILSGTDPSSARLHLDTGRMLGDDFVLGDNYVRTILSFGPFCPDDPVRGLFCPGRICPRAEYHGGSLSQHGTTGRREVPKVCEWYVAAEMEFSVRLRKPHTDPIKLQKQIK